MNQNQNVQSGRSADATRLGLILAAEELFGDSGVDAVSLRTICAAAGQKNVSSVQYHFGDKYALLSAVMEYRETQIEPIRKVMLDEARKQGWLGDLRTILRILFEPYAMMFLDDGNIAYIKLISSYTNHIRPRGVVMHPADYPGASYPSLHEAVSLLKERLSFLDEHRFDQRAETVSSMFYGAFIQFAARDPKLGFDKYLLYEDTLEMMVAAIAAPLSRPA